MGIVSDPDWAVMMVADISIKVTDIDLTGIDIQRKLEASGERIALQALRGMDKFVPMDTGQLRNSAEAGNMEVVYGTDYAVYPWQGRGTIHRDKNPMATSHWEQAYQASGMQNLLEEVSRIVAE